MKRKKLIYLIQISIFSALALIVSMIKFPLFFFPDFYKLDFSNSVILISAFCLGPLAGFLTLSIKLFLSLIFFGSTSFGIGQLADFFSALAIMLPSSLIYKNFRTFKGACLAMLTGIICSLLFSAVINYFFIIPAYQTLLSLKESSIISLARSFNPNVKDKLSFVLFIVCPFNFLKEFLVCLLTTLLYKNLSIISKEAFCYA